MELVSLTSAPDQGQLRGMKQHGIALEQTEAPSPSSQDSKRAAAHHLVCKKEKQQNHSSMKQDIPRKKPVGMPRILIPTGAEEALQDPPEKPVDATAPCPGYLSPRQRGRHAGGPLQLIFCWSPFSDLLLVELVG